MPLRSAHRRVFAFAGIGRPKKFIASLEQGGAAVAGSCFFADHHPYADDEILQLKAIAGETMLVTTEKDFVRLSVTQRERHPRDQGRGGVRRSRRDWTACLTGHGPRFS